MGFLLLMAWITFAQADQLEEKAETSPEQMPNDRRQGAIRSGRERRKIDVPPPPGSPVRSGLDRRTGDRRRGDRRTSSLQAR